MATVPQPSVNGKPPTGPPTTSFNPFAEYLREQSHRYANLQRPYGENKADDGWLADLLSEMAAEAERLLATNGEQFWTRRETQQCELERKAYGYDRIVGRGGY